MTASPRWTSCWARLRSSLPGRRIVALGGWGEPEGQLSTYLLGLTGADEPRVCFLATAKGDSAEAVVLFYEAFAARSQASHLELFGVPRSGIREHLLGQHLILVAGGNTANMLAVWRVHGVDRVLREAWEAGIVLTGWSAGANCWFEGCVTDSFGPDLARLDDGLGFLSGTFCPHYDSETDRRATYQRLVSEGLPPGIGADDAVGVVFEGAELAEVVTERAGARAYQVAPGSEQPLETRLLV